MSLPLLVAAPAGALGRTLQYSVLATSGGIPHRATVTIDFVGGSAERVMDVDVAEVDDAGPPLDAAIGIEPTGALRAESRNGLTNEEEALCSLMALESEDMYGVAVGDHWEREGRVPGGRHHTRFAVLGVTDAGLVQLAVSRDLTRDDGSVAHWRGTMFYDADSSVPATISLNGNVSASDDPADGRNVALTMRLIHDTFKHY